ncbi:hypothetical protein Tco_0682142 [Tanacetum coccineum]|uniref:Reverse transcriptase domain, Reverse transcriptase zinc-binding domain protein n=1 Tax=Tanacetum coccineum TaxID=301880 RepID=A0ABQ4XS86_9ASTR
MMTSGLAKGRNASRQSSSATALPQNILKIWNRIKGMADLGSSTTNVYDIIHNLLPFVKRRTTRSVIAKLVVAAIAYYVWQERNWRLFKKGKRSSDQIVECILSTIRLKLLSCKLKKSKSGESLERLWNLPEAVFV